MHLAMVIVTITRSRLLFCDCHQRSSTYAARSSVVRIMVWRILAHNWNTMAKKLTPVLVYVWPTKHKGNDVWKVAIDDVGIGPLFELKTRYTRKHGAVKGAARKLNKMSIAPGRHAEVVYSKPPKR